MNTFKENMGLYIRCAIVAFFTIGGFSMPLSYDPIFPFASVFFFLGFALLMPVTMRMSMKLQPKRNWAKPTWFTNPLSGPPHSFHAAAWGFMGMGIVATIRTLLSGHIISTGLFPLCGGLGVYVAIRRFYAHAPRTSKTGPNAP